MRLISKSSLYFIPAILLVFFISGVLIHSFLEDLILEEVEEDLAKYKTELALRFEVLDNFNDFLNPLDGSIELGAETKNKLSEPIFSDTLIYSDYDHEYVPYRQLHFTIKKNDITRLVTIRKSLLESDDLVEGLIISLGFAFLIMIVVFSIINYVIARTLWKPFRNILDNMKLFSFQTRNGFEPVRTDITEFNELNNELSKMTNKLTRDYFSLKEFSENASHEMQTPLAIIQAKLELLFQQQGLNDEHLKAINSAYQAANRLSRLHHELNLLTRIENMEFKDRSVVNLKVLLEKQIDNFMDIVEQKKLSLVVVKMEHINITGNAYLLEILISNLINNSIKHNLSDGKIYIDLSQKKLNISNTGVPLRYPTEYLFDRFRKGEVRSDSTGLGLSIAKQICMVHNFTLDYEYKNGMHTLTINFTSV